MKAELMEMVLPEVDFRRADIRDVVRYLNGSMIMGQEDVPVITLILADQQTVDPVDIQMKNASVYEILCVVSETSDSKFYIRGGQPYLEPRRPHPMSQKELRARSEAEKDPFR